jgi:hypothetical protein
MYLAASRLEDQKVAGASLVVVVNELEFAALIPLQQDLLHWDAVDGHEQLVWLAAQVGDAAVACARGDALDGVRIVGAEVGTLCRTNGSGGADCAGDCAGHTAYPCWPGGRDGDLAWAAALRDNVGLLFYIRQVWVYLFFAAEGQQDGEGCERQGEEKDFGFHLRENLKSDCCFEPRRCDSGSKGGGMAGRPSITLF